VTGALRVIIDAQIAPNGAVGGVEQFIAGLVRALGRLDDGPEEYTIVGSSENTDWLTKFSGANQRVVVGPRRERPLEGAKRRFGSLRKPAGLAWRRLRNVLPARLAEFGVVPRSQGFYETLGGRVLHFPYQAFVRTALPTVFNPHDLQHRHFPGFFTKDEVSRREVVYRAGCRESAAVVVESRWIADDIIRQYRIPSQKVVVVPLAPSTDLCDAPDEDELRAVVARFDLPARFALYPAQTWPHKNHTGLIDALARLRASRGLELHVVCTGRKNETWPAIERHLRDARLEDRVRFRGYVSPSQLRALYRLAFFLVFPSLFEGCGLPVLEAFAEGLPVVCSNVPPLVEAAGDAALTFDPSSPESIVEALHRALTDPALLAELRRRGLERARAVSWERTARTYRALYRRAAGTTLSKEDRVVLADVLQEPESPATPAGASEREGDRQYSALVPSGAPVGAGRGLAPAQMGVRS
jgi:glycosyltransferase involved in cell wall biosynthesis